MNAPRIETLPANVARTRDVERTAYTMYAAWLNEHNVRWGMGDSLYNVDDLADDSEVMGSITGPDCTVVHISANNSDDGGPASLIVTYRPIGDENIVTSLVSHFDSSACIVYADERFFIENAPFPA